MAGNRAMGIPTALIYTRVSTDDQAREGLSLPAQLADTRRYAAQRGCLIGGEYSDVVSGKRDDRPQYQALLAEVRRRRSEGQSVMVVVKWLDRFGRDLLERARSAKELRILDVAMHSVMEGGEVPPFVADMLAVLAQEEVRRLGERVSAVRQHAVEGGWFFPGRLPWGYAFRPATEAERAQGSPTVVLDLDPSAAPFVREAFERAKAGESVRGIGRWAQALPEPARGGRHLGFSVVRELLSAPVYIARPSAGADDVLGRPIGRWPAMVDEATWATVQHRIADHARHPHQASKRFLLTGYMRCPKCGARMVGNTGGVKPPAYYCIGNRKGSAAGASRDCYGVVPAKTLDGAVIALVGKLLAVATSADPKLRARLQAVWGALSRPSDDGSRRRAQELVRTTAEAKTRLARAAGMLVDGTIDKMGYEALRDAVLADVESANAELSRLRGREPSAILPDLDTVLRAVESWHAVLAAADVAAQRDVLEPLIERVVPRRVGYGKYEAEVTWTALGGTLRALAEAIERDTLS